MFIILLSSLIIALVLIVSLGISGGYMYAHIISLDITIPTFAYMQFYMTLFSLQFIFGCLAVKERFRLLNNYLR